MDTAILEEIGLTKNEAKVYLALVELGSASATSIIHKTGMHRGNVYDMLRQLMKKGLAGEVVIEGRTVFEAGSHQPLQALVKVKKERLDAIMPELAKISKSTPNITVRVLKGEEGMLTVLDEIIQSMPDEVLVLGGGGERYALIPTALDRFHKRRAQHKIKHREIFRDNPSAHRRGEMCSKMPYTQVRYLPPHVNEPTLIRIWNNQVTLFSMVPECTAVITIIENKQLATTFREYFEVLWQISKE